MPLVTAKLTSITKIIVYQNESKIIFTQYNAQKPTHRIVMYFFATQFFRTLSDTAINDTDT